MNELLQIIRCGKPATGVQFRQHAYGRDDVRRFLRDVLALANAPVKGARYIVVGMDVDSGGRRRLEPVDESDFSGKPSYRSLVAEYIEPRLDVRYQAVTAEGARLGVFEISGCHDKPYMMRADLCESLRRGDAYMRVENMPVKMGRRQLQKLFEKKFSRAVAADSVEVGFPGEIMHKELRIEPVDLGQLPSALASAKIMEMMEIHTNPANRGATTFISRMVHARLFGSDDPYENRSREELERELAEIQTTYARDDQRFLFENNHESLQLVVLNQGERAIEDASLQLVLPQHAALHVARQLPESRCDGNPVRLAPAEPGDYPAVTTGKDSITISKPLGNIAPDVPQAAFGDPPRICVGDALKGRWLAIRYRIAGKNLRRPSTGQLKLLF